MRAKRHITFSLKRYGKVSTAYMIRMRISYGGQRIDVATGFCLPEPAFWDAQEERVKEEYVPPKNSPDSGVINGELREMRRRAERVLEEEGRAGGAKEFRERLRRGPAPGEPDLFECLEMFVREAGVKNEWTEATRRKFRVLENDLRIFRRGLEFGDLTEEGLVALVRFWREERNLGNATVAGKLALLRWFLNWATEKGYNPLMAYRGFRPALKKPRRRVIFLNKQELERLQALVLPWHYRYLEEVRDVFLFCCFSGLRHSDAVNLRRSDIRGEFIEITTVKTADSLSIELNGATREILDKYARRELPGGRALPTLLNQTMNRDLKTLCRLAGIDEEVRITVYKGGRRIDTVRPKYALVGTHTGRRTFIVTALSLGVPPNVVMKWTGHSDYKAMKPYIDIADTVKAREMTKMDSFYQDLSGSRSDNGR